MMRHSRAKVRALLESGVQVVEKATLPTHNIEDGRGWAHAAWQHLVGSGALANWDEKTAVQRLDSVQEGLALFMKQNPLSPDWAADAADWFLENQYMEAVSFMREVTKSTIITKIQDIDAYNPADANDAQLKDDFRIALAWYATLKDPNKNIRFTRDQIKSTLSKIMREMVKRGIVQFNPAGMQPAARELFDEVASEINLPQDMIKQADEMAGPDAITSMSDEQLIQFSVALSEVWLANFSEVDIGEQDVSKLSREDVVNAAIFVSQEADKRDLDIEWPDSLERAMSMLKACSGKDKIHKALTLVPELNSVLKELPEVVVIQDYVSVVGSSLYGDGFNPKEPGDIDVLVRSGQPDPSQELKLVRALRQKSLPHELQFIYYAAGPNWSYLPIYDLVLRPKKQMVLQRVDDGLHQVPEQIELAKQAGSTLGALLESKIHYKFTKTADQLYAMGLMTRDERIALSGAISQGLKAFNGSVPDDLGQRSIDMDTVLEVLKAAIVLMRPFTPLKAAGGYHVGEFFKFVPLWDLWGKEHIGNGIAVEEKFDGIRMVAHKKGDKVAIYTEDAKRDRAGILPEVVKDIQNLPTDEAILDGEMVWWKGGEPIPRHDMLHLVSGKTPLMGDDLHFNIFDALWSDGKSIADKPWTERQQVLRRMIPGDHKGHIWRVQPTIAKSRADLLSAFTKAAKGKGSEGAMFKDISAAYDLSGRTGAWAKLKLVKEVKMVVIGRSKKFPTEVSSPGFRKQPAKWNFDDIPTKTFVYRVAFKDGDKLIPMEADAKVAESDLQVRFVPKGDKDPVTGQVASADEWRGLEDPKLWQMGEGFSDRKPGELAYANTYATNVEAKIGDIITVAPIMIREWVGDDGHKHYSWMFPNVRELDPTRGEPDTLGDVLRIIRETGSRTPGKQTPAEKTITSEAGGKKNPAHASDSFVDDLHERWKWPSAGSVAKQATHADQQLAEERAMGDPYMVHQKDTSKQRFVVQHHYRGIWSDEERKQLNQGLKRAQELAGDDKSAAQKMLDGLWKTFKIELKTADFQTISESGQKAANSNSDVTAAIKQHLGSQPPAVDELPKVLPNVVNRGNVHVDFRIKSPEGNWLIGWTMDTPGIALQTLDGKLHPVLRDKFLDNQEDDNIQAQRKARQPLAWLTLVGPGEAKYQAEPGEVGGTEGTAGEFTFQDKGEVVFGVQKSDYHEYFLFFDKNKHLNGRWGIQLIRGKPDYTKVPDEFWMVNRPKATQEPYITTHDLEKEQAKAKKDRIQIIWNPDTIKALAAAGYGDLPEVEKFVPVIKAKLEERLVYGVVLEPETLDAHGEIISKDEIRRAAHHYLEFYQKAGFQHGKSKRWPQFPEGLRLLESFIAPVDMVVNAQKIKAGSWVMAMRVDHDGLWEDVKTGRVTGFSIGGIARALHEQRLAA